MQVTQVTRAVLRSHPGLRDLKTQFRSPSTTVVVPAGAVGAAPAQGSKADHIKCQGRLESFPNTVTGGKPWPCGWDLLVALGPEMQAGVREAGMWKPLNLTSWRGACGGRTADTQPAAGGLDYSKLVKEQLLSPPPRTLGRFRDLPRVT